MEKIRQLLQNRWVFLVIVALGLDLRMGAAMLGHNFDMDSWYIVADIMRHGGNVYVETVRYNYGPGWFLILHELDVLSGYNHAALRYLIAAFLSFVDLGICLILCRKAGRLAGALFFLNPASILISGYHCQFDNLAILVALWSVLLYGEDFAGPVNRRKLCGLLVLGLSLIFKHVFFMFPLWLAVKQKGLWQKMVVLFVPCACFLASFAPYWAVAHREIIQHVFCYETIPGGFIYRYFIPQCIQFAGTAARCGMACWFCLRSFAGRETVLNHC